MHVDQTNAVLKNALYKIGHDPDDSEYSRFRCWTHGAEDNLFLGQKKISKNAFSSGFTAEHRARLPADQGVR